MNNKPKFSLNVDDFLQKDLIVFNNPVLIQGIAITPVVSAAVSLKSALALSLAVLILIVPTRFIGDLLFNKMPNWLRPMLYAIMAAALYIPANITVLSIFGSMPLTLALYMPLLVVDTITLSRSEISAKEGALRAGHNGVMTSVGFALIACCVGSFREILGAGKIFGVKLFESAPMPFLSTVGGGLIILALLAALFQSIVALYRAAHPSVEEVGDDV